MRFLLTMHIWHIFFSAKQAIRSGIGEKIKVRLLLGFLLLTIWLGFPMPVVAQAIDSMASQMAAQVAADQVAKDQTPESAAESAAESAVGESLFTANCAACHANGGNIIRRGKNLKQKTLLRNGYGEVDAIAHLITQGKGAMPAYADRLSEGEIEAIAQYVQQQAATGW